MIGTVADEPEAIYTDVAVPADNKLRIVVLNGKRSCRSAVVDGQLAIGCCRRREPQNRGERLIDIFIGAKSEGN